MNGTSQGWSEWVAAHLERGSLPVPMPLERAVARLARATAPRRLARPLAAGEGKEVLAIGGATLGGSGVTPLAFECAAWIAERGRKVAIVGHGYRARPGGPRVVSPDDSLADVGDEALLHARAAHRRGLTLPVVVAPSRRQALAHAAMMADVVVLDGALQIRPTRAHLSLLCVDGRHPWGSQRVVPSGDLKASPRTLARLVDATVAIFDEDVVAPFPFVVQRRSAGAWRGGALVPWAQLRELRVGLLTALARPSRVMTALAHRGVVPVATVTARDHGPVLPSHLAAMEAHERARPIDLWLATEKCALHVDAASSGHRPVAILDHRFVLGGRLATLLAHRFFPTRAAADLLDPGGGGP